ncbi:hypothetical protein KY312_02835, partial [Candidatus Woesearchaeota archaeon]|nr:hypothetical protein [Candidatus Woesearchaeota archaeon]
ILTKTKDYQLINERKKDKIIDFLEQRPSSTLEISTKIGLSKDSILKHLHELKKENKINYKIKGKTYIWYLK